MAEARVFRPRFVPGMRFDTLDCQQRAFDVLPTYAPSFTGQKEVVKLGRWFSWNAAASEQLPEFWIAKMLLEHHFDGSIPDPDEASATQVAFDDLRGRANVGSPRLQPFRTTARQQMADFVWLTS